MQNVFRPKCIVQEGNHHEKHKKRSRPAGRLERGHNYDSIQIRISRGLNCFQGSNVCLLCNFHRARHRFTHKSIRPSASRSFILSDVYENLELNVI